MLFYLLPMALEFNNSFLTTALGLLALATIAGLGFQRANTTSLREQLKDTRDEVVALRGQRSDDRSKISELTADLEALKRVFTGEIHWQELNEQLIEHHREALEHWTEHEDIVEKMDAKVDQLMKKVDQLIGLVQ